MDKLNIGRFLIGLVLTINLQCVLSFLFAPGCYAPAFELSGYPGIAALKGLGVLFLMWNIPYITAFIHPTRFRTSLYEAIVMQTIGLTGEAFITLSVPPSSQILINSLQRFIFFDAAGLICLITAAVTLRNQDLFFRHSPLNH